jgi:hypothetical protein
MAALRTGYESTPGTSDYHYVHCAQCGCDYSYTSKRKPYPQATRRLLEGTDAASAFARRLQASADAAPCPNCLFIPPEFDFELAPLGKAIRWAGVVTSVAGWIGGDIFLNKWVEAPMPMIFGAAFAVPGMILCAIASVFRRKICPEKRPVLLTKYNVRAISPQATAKIMAVTPEATSLDREPDVDASGNFNADESPPAESSATAPPGSEVGIESDRPPHGNAARRPPTSLPATITVRCPCGKKFTVDRNFAGKRARCKICNNIVQIPAA